MPDPILEPEGGDDGGPAADPSSRGVYGISVAAELVGMGSQNLRQYEARGLLEPARTAGGTRRYSVDDLDRLRHIGALLDAGLNLAGIAMVLDLEGQLAVERAELRSVRPNTDQASRDDHDGQPSSR